MFTAPETCISALQPGDESEVKQEERGATLASTCAGIHIKKCRLQRCGRWWESFPSFGWEEEEQLSWSEFVLGRQKKDSFLQNVQNICTTSRILVYLTCRIVYHIGSKPEIYPQLVFSFPLKARGIKEPSSPEELIDHVFLQWWGWRCQKAPSKCQCIDFDHESFPPRCLCSA